MLVRKHASPLVQRQRVNSHAGGAAGEVQKSVEQMRIKTLMVEKPPRVARSKLGGGGRGSRQCSTRSECDVDVLLNAEHDDKGLCRLTGCFHTPTAALSL